MKTQSPVFTIILLLLFGCFDASLRSQSFTPSYQLSDQLNEKVAQNPVFSEGFTGFYLADAVTGREVYNFRADKHFIPASNVKLFTYFLTQQVLRDTVPAIFYRETPDTLHLWGTGYPLLLHPLFAEHDRLTPWLQQQEKILVYHSDPSHQLPRYGSGWSWDDYNDAYVYERHLLPTYGNMLWLNKEDATSDTEIYPPRFRYLLDTVPQRSRASRSEYALDFKVANRIIEQPSFEIRRPLPTSDTLMVSLLSEALGKEVLLAGGNTLHNRACCTPKDRYFGVSLPDTIYRKLLQDSDNFLAEQLLILAASKRYGVPDIKAILRYAKDTLHPELAISQRQWVDGSGLSRYNQFTPRQLGQLLLRMNREIGLEHLQGLLATGGETGTLSTHFVGKDQPYVWAKTGSLRNVLCVSGFLQTGNGRMLVFSFMHNHFPGKSRFHYHEMEEILAWVRDNL